MKKSVVSILFVLCCACVLRISSVAAQENNEDKFSFGKVVSVNAQQVTVKEYDFAKDADVEMVYNVTAETELGNVNAVTDLAANDDIVIDYVEKDGKRVVTTLVKEEKGAETAAPAVSAAPAADAPAVTPAVAAPAPVADAPAAPAAAAPVADAPAAPAAEQK